MYSPQESVNFTRKFSCQKQPQDGRAYNKRETISVWKTMLRILRCLTVWAAVYPSRLERRKNVWTDQAVFELQARVFWMRVFLWFTMSVCAFHQPSVYSYLLIALNDDSTSVSVIVAISIVS